ncbi:MAG TPA: hypothetical protein VL282_12220, partial [Tepidisphaeraceae bacterium]|nr:hypothetical protein [Tepidisphaeraceae bacterium]
LHKPGDASNASGKRLVVEQSGRHLNLTGPSDKTYSMKMIDSDYTHGQVRVHLIGNGAEAFFQGPERSDRFTFTLSDPDPQEWTATAVSRMYPRPQKPAARPTTQHARID